MTLPKKGIHLDDLQEATQLLLSCGAEIQEINTIRKHLEELKGGGLARRVYPATMITLILSDVIGNPLDVIASGPTTPDPSTYFDAVRILKKYQIWDRVSETIRSVLKDGMEGKLPETVKENDACLQRVQNIIVGKLSCLPGGYPTAKNLGFNTMLLTNSLHGEAREAGKFLASVLRQVVATGDPMQRPVCILAGGETTVKITGSGLGGRNQELALSAAADLAGLRDVMLIALATDGEDGPTDSAGAVATGQSLDTAVSLGMSHVDYLKNNDSYHFFEQLNSSLKIGPTGTNVNDITFLFAF